MVAFNFYYNILHKPRKPVCDSLFNFKKFWCI